MPALLVVHYFSERKHENSGSSPVGRETNEMYTKKYHKLELPIACMVQTRAQKIQISQKIIQEKYTQIEFSDKTWGVPRFHLIKRHTKNKAHMARKLCERNTRN